MKYGNKKRGLLQAVALGQVLLLAAAGCKSPSNKGVNDVVVSQALVGKDGPVTVTAANTIVNGYSALTGTPTATTVTVNALADFTAGGRPALAVGDLILIIQMQGATIDTTDTTAYGTVSDLGSAGNYELAGVAGIVAATNTITLGCARKHAYTVANKAQVIRVPQYTTLTINSGASITAPAWNGTVGGVVAVHASNTLQLTGNIDVIAKGFRGGTSPADNTNPTSGANTITYRGAATDGAMKGESIAGWPGDFTYPYGRGAPANGGGGGNWHNAGGGGGANAAASGEGSDGGGGVNNWTGEGVMLNTAAWRLDPEYALSGGPGGGRGGYTYSANNLDATTQAPGLAGWGGNDRREHGGLGGHPLASSTGGANPRLFLGGGGGAGDRNNGYPGPGGAGGGLALVVAGTVAGTGSILANGGPGGNSDSTASTYPNYHGDAAGGGGGGGTVVVHAALLSGISVVADGGAGGNQLIPNGVGNAGTDEAEGPGGGGGGGYVALSGAPPAGGTAATASASGTSGGTTNSRALTEFLSNGATAGNAGVTNGDATSILFCTDAVVPETIIVTHPNNPTNVKAGAFTFSSSGGVFPADGAVPTDGTVTFQCSLNGGALAACPAAYTTPALDDGWYTLSVQTTDLSGNVGPSVDYTWRVDTIAPVTTILTYPPNPSSSSTASFTFTSNESGEEIISFSCKLDTGAFAACTADYTITGLSDTSHTLYVHAQDQAGNVGADVSYPWTVHALGLDGGADAQPQDASAADASPTLDSADAPLVLLDASVDASLGLDSADAPVVVLLDAGVDASADAPVTIVDAPVTIVDAPVIIIDAPATIVDAPVTIVDAGADVAALVDLAPPGGGQDVPPIGAADGAADAPDAGAVGLLDAALDGNGGDADAQDARAVVLLDARSIDASAAPDQAVLPPDAEMVVDAPVVGQEPDAEEYGSLKAMGSGFCAVNPMHDSAPGLFTFFLVAAFGLLLRRRRR